MPPCDDLGVKPILLKLAAGANGLIWVLGAWMTWSFLDQMRSAPDGWRALGTELLAYFLVPIGLIAGVLPAYLIYRKTRSLRWKRVALITITVVMSISGETCGLG